MENDNITSFPANDVNIPADTQTAGDSSSVPQTPAADQGATQDTTSPATTDAQQQGNQAVPYERFKEVNESFKQTQAELRALREQQTLALKQQQQFMQQQMPQQPVNPEIQQAKQQLKGLIQELAPELGFVSKQEIERQQAIQEVENTHSQLATKYNGKDGLPKYNKQEVLDYAIKLGMTSAAGLEIAYKQMHEAEIMNARFQQMMQQTRGVKSETSNGTGSANTGVGDSDLKKAAQEGDKDAVHLLLKRRLSGK